MNAKSPAPPVGTRSSCRAGSGCRRTARSCCGDRRPGCWAWTRGRRSSSTTCPPPLARMLDELAAPAERVGLVARAVQRGAHRDAAEELLRRLVDAGVLVDADGPDRVARQRAAAGRHRGGRRTGRGRDRHGARTRRRRQRVDRCGRRRRRAGGRSRDRSARRRPRPVGRSRRSWTSSGGSRRERASGRPPAGPRRTCACSPTPSSPNRHGSRHCTATGSRTCPYGCATAPGSSGRWCCRAARRASDAWSCTGAPATPAGRPSRPSSSGDPAAAVPPRRRQPRRWGSRRCWRRWTSRRPRGGDSTGARRHAGARSRLGRAAAPPVAGAPGLHVWRTTARADMRAARRTGDNHEVMSAARPLK